MKNRTGDLTRRDFIELSAAVAAGAMLPKFAAAQTAAAGYDYESLPPLRETAAKKGIYFGCATDAARLDISKGGKDYEADFSDAVARGVQHRRRGGRHEMGYNSSGA
ncbi:MAG: twin-arginine translocation signal domain-containing protein [Alphaproteobacteria bacterium]